MTTNFNVDQTLNHLTENRGHTVEEVAKHYNTSVDKVTEIGDLSTRPAADISADIRAKSIDRILGGIYSMELHGNRYTIGGKVTAYIHTNADTDARLHDEWDVKLEGIVRYITKDYVDVLPVIYYKDGESFISKEEWDARVRHIGNKHLTIHTSKARTALGGTIKADVISVEQPPAETRPTEEEFRNAAFGQNSPMLSNFTPKTWAELNERNGWKNALSPLTI